MSDQSATSQYKAYVRARIERGLRELDEGKTASHQDVRAALFQSMREAQRSPRAARRAE